MAANSAKLMELLCTRLCHDITGPVGAIANGAEFLAEEDTGMQGQAIELITQSASEAVNRLQFYRMAYGKVGAKGEANLSDCKEIVRKFLDNGKVSLDWPDQFTDTSNMAVSRHTARVIYNMVIMAAGVLIRGGTLSVRLLQDEYSNSVISVNATGMTLKWDEKLGKALAHTLKVDDLEPATVQAYFTKMIADEAGVELQVAQGTENFELRATQKQMELAN